MKYTGNYQLKKPDGTDVVNIEDFNDNADKIDTELKNLNNNKVDKVAGKQLSTEDYTTADKTKLTGIAAGANNYVHPPSHPASIITQDANNRFVTDAEKANWNAAETNANEYTDQKLTEQSTDYVKNPANGGTTAGTATAYTCNSSPNPTALVDKMGLMITAHIDSGANPTLKWGSIAAKSIKKPNGSAAILKKNGLYTLRYNSVNDSFILQGESEVEVGKQIITPSTVNQAITKGVHDGTGYVEGSPNLISSNIRSGVNLFNVLGTLRTTANIAIQSITANVYATTSGPHTSSVLIPGIYKPLYWTCTGIFGSYPEYGSGGGYKYYVETKTATGLSTYVSMVLYGQNHRYVSLSGNVVLRDGKYYFDYSGTGSWDQVDINSGFCTFYINFICET